MTSRALRSVGLSRRILEGPPIFVPSALQAAFGEYVARKIGEPHLGPLVIGRYENMGIYAQYVLDAPRLDAAFGRGVRALPFLQSGTTVGTIDEGEIVVLQYGSGIQSVVGARHVDEATIVLLIDLVRNFVGPEWNPEWVELSQPAHSGAAPLEDAFRAPIRYGSRLPGIAIRKCTLLTRNPRPVEARESILFSDLRSMIKSRPPSSAAELVRDALVVLSGYGDFSEEAVAERLGVGKRTLQRLIRVEGYTFREILASFRADRAKALLRETDLSVQEIAFRLGYIEVNSFRRSFRNWTSMTPTEFTARRSAKQRR
ncbi:AraC family transcriptional regulator [Pseudoruegeria sp. M32A2M]|nr:AraC family transcriptional regulator [Pseudoruegeria sp. M32A2M]